MTQLYGHRRATLGDIETIVRLLSEDILGKTREHPVMETLAPCYIAAFEKIDRDPNQYLMVVEDPVQIVATCHLTLMPSLTCKGATRMQIEGVRVSEAHRNKKIGQWMIEVAIRYAKSQQVSMIQLTTNKKRVEAKKFYTQLGFEASHEGMKLSLEEK